MQLRCAPKRSSSGSAQAHLFRQPLCKSSDEEAIDEGDEDEWADEAEDARQEDEGEEEDVSSSSEDSVSDFNVGQATLDNAHNRQWYSRKTLQSRFFPFKALELGLMLAWDSTGKRISRRKMDSLLALISDPKFDAKKLIGFTAKKLRGLRKTLPLVTTESIKCTKTVIKKVRCCMSYMTAARSLQVVDAEGLISTKVHEYKNVRVTYVSLTDFIRRVFSDPVQRSSLRFGVEETGDGLVIYVSIFLMTFVK